MWDATLAQRAGHQSLSRMPTLGETGSEQQSRTAPPLVMTICAHGRTPIETPAHAQAVETSRADPFHRVRLWLSLVIDSETER
jgi:hypothetical protein